MRQFASALDVLNGVIDSRAVIGALLVAAVTAGAGLVWRNWRRPLQVTWSVLYDEKINQGADLWQISYQGDTITQGSLVILEVRNSGSTSIVETLWGNGDSLAFSFPGRAVKGFKVRDNVSVHEAVKRRPPDVASAGESGQIVLPKFNLGAGESFKLMLLLTGEPGAVERVTGVIEGGRIVRHERLPRHYRLLAMATAAGLLAGGIAGGVHLANDALTPSASCATGHLLVEGSTAFAPVANQARNSYRQLCGDGATITIAAVGSENGLQRLEGSHGTSTIAMTDGLPASSAGAEALNRRAVGVVTFAVVANGALRAQYPDLFQGGGVSADRLRQIFSGGGAGGAGEPPLIAVGRVRGSGTRSAFADAFFGGSDPEPSGGPCRTTTRSGFCVAGTTMDLLSFVNSHANAIGYAEADALPYFPDVQVTPVDGQSPTTSAVKSGAYPFVATEYLYTAGAPAGLTADFLDFLTSSAETAALRGHGYLACPDLSGSRLSGACAG